MPQYDLVSLTNVPQQRRSEAFLQRVLGAAESVLLREGIDGFTIRAVATEGKVSLGGIYRRFVDRDELLAAIHAHRLQVMERRIVLALRDARGASLPEFVAVFVETLAASFQDEGQLLASLAPPYPRLAEAARARALQSQELLVSEFLGAASAPLKVEAHPDPRAAVAFVLQMSLAMFTRRILFPQSMGEDGGDWLVLTHNVSDAATAYLMWRRPVRTH